MRLFIAEKPSVAKAIAAELGAGVKHEGYIQCGSDRVTWGFGHMLEMATPDQYRDEWKAWKAEDLPLLPEAWKLLPKDDAKKQLGIIGKLLKEAHVIVNCGDPDREGQLLVDELLEHFGNRRQVLRYWVSANDATSVRRGLDQLKDNAEYSSFGMAALARQRADWLLGMNFSRAFTLQAQRGGAQKTVLSVGRVQTPTLALVVQRDREIENHKPRAFFRLTAHLQHAGGTFTAAWQPGKDQAGLDEEGRLIDAAVATSVAAAATGKTGALQEYTQEAKKKSQPLAWSLSAITLAASNRHGYSADDVLKACQSLYETHKLASYPRTDCGHLPESQHSDAPAVLAALRQVNPHLAAKIDKADPGIKSPTWDDGKVTAHHGIIPTMHAGDAGKLSEIERDIYALIVQAYLAQFYPAHEYMATVVVAKVGEELFKATGRTVTRAGWRELYVAQDEADDSTAEGEGGDADQALPAMAQGDAVTCTQVARKDEKTKPPARFTEGTLGVAMENIHRFITDPAAKKILKEGDGIGTPATRASIITELKRRGFIEPKGKKQIVSTELGRGLIDALPPEVKSAALTAAFERTLREIEKGRANVDAFVAAQVEFVKATVAKANQGSVTIAGTVGPSCPQCKTGFLRRLPRKGDKAGFFWGCNRFSEGCKAIFNDHKGKADLASGPTAAVDCPKCKAGGQAGRLRLLKGATNNFWGCSRYAEGCKTTYPDAAGKPNFNPAPRK